MSRILSIYLDMFSSHYLHSGNADFKETSLDKKMQEFGGIFYSNCYTPAPDTGRSAACMWTGKYPRENGCDERFKWPKYFLKSNGQDIFTLLKQNNYQIDIYCDLIYYRAGLFPDSIKKEEIESDYRRFLEKNRNASDLFTLLYLPDLHHYLANWGYNLDAYNKACDFCCGILDEVFHELTVDSYDYVLIFGDHGFMLDKSNKARNVLDDCRTKTGVLVKKQKDDFSVDNSLYSITDLYYTILNFAGIDQNPNGLGGKKHEYIMIEDHRNLSNNIGEPIANWKIVTSDNQYWISENGDWHFLYEETDFKSQYWERKLANEMTSFSMMMKLYKAKQEYLFGCYVKKTVYGNELKVPLYRKMNMIFSKCMSKLFKSIKTVIFIIKGNNSFWRKK